MNRAFRKDFEFVKKNFFPKWDKKSLWKIKIVPHLPLRGICEKERKTILIKQYTENNNELYWILIHEICHAIISPYHGKRFYERLLKASKQAEKMGFHELVNYITKDLNSKSHPLIAKEIYNEIFDIVVDCPHITLQQMIKSLAKQNGMYAGDFFLNRFKKTKSVFKEAKQFVKHSRNVKRKFLFSLDRKITPTNNFRPSRIVS